MAFLDDLKKEAEQHKQHAAIEAHKKTAEVTQNFLLAQSKFKIILAYLDDLVNQLNVIDLRVTRPYFIDGFGLIENFRQEDYAVKAERIAIEQKEFINFIQLRFKCSTDTAISFEKKSHAAIELQRKYLWENGLKHQCTEYKNDKGIVDRATFHVDSQIPVAIKFSADFENAKFTLSLKNLNGLTSNEFNYDADEITDALLDEFGKYLVDRPNSFKNMGRYQARKTASPPPVTKRPDEVEYVKLDPETEQELEKQGNKKPGLLDSIKSFLS
jgi:hypothetical protein